MGRRDHEDVGDNLDRAWQPFAQPEGTTIVLGVIHIGFDRVAVPDRPWFDRCLSVFEAPVERIVDQRLRDVPRHPPLEGSLDLPGNREAPEQIRRDPGAEGKIGIKPLQHGLTVEKPRHRIVVTGAGLEQGYFGHRGCEIHFIARSSITGLRAYLNESHIEIRMIGAVTSRREIDSVMVSSE